MESRQPIRVLVTQIDPVAQAGLSVALGHYSDLEVVAAETWWASTEGVDVVVADYERGMGLLSAAVIQKAHKAAIRVLIITTNVRESDVGKALKCGVRGYVLAGRSLDTLVDAVREVHVGRIHLDPELAQRLAQGLYTESLTTREEEVLSHVVDGRCNKEIAGILDVALGTVKSHLRAVYGKLEVGSRTQAVAAVAKRGLLRQDVRNFSEASWPTADTRAQEPPPPHGPNAQVAVDQHASSSMPRALAFGLEKSDGRWSLELSRIWTARQRDFGETE